MRILAYCVMPNHWHLLLWPYSDGDLSRFIKWLTTTHAVRWNRAHATVGNGAVYQSRFKSIPVEPGSHLYWAWRYVERNALRANLVQRAQDWPWGSLKYRTAGLHPEWLDEGPVQLPADWNDLVNIPQTNAELDAFRLRMNIGQPFGHEGWLAKTDKPRGRPTFEKRKNRV
jgi:putative transposase